MNSSFYCAFTFFYLLSNHCVVNNDYSSSVSTLVGLVRYYILSLRSFLLLDSPFSIFEADDSKFPNLSSSSSPIGGGVGESVGVGVEDSSVGVGVSGGVGCGSG